MSAYIKSKISQFLPKGLSNSHSALVIIKAIFLILPGNAAIFGIEQYTLVYFKVVLIGISHINSKFLVLYKFFIVKAIANEALPTKDRKFKKTKNKLMLSKVKSSNLTLDQNPYFILTATEDIPKLPKPQIQ